MDFFKSVFSNDPDGSSSPRQKELPEESPQNPIKEEDADEIAENNDPNPDPSSPTASSIGGSAWSFGGLIKTFASRSESVIQTYRKDLEEFGSGLKKETAAIREVASRAVKDLPASLEVGASVAQESLESVGQVIDEFGGSVWRGTAEIISQGKDALISIDSDTNANDPFSDSGAQSSKRYGRFEVQVLGIQSDLSTFSEEPEDADDYRIWKSGFQLADKVEEIENLCYENGVLEGFLEKLVPDVVDYDTFWSRYFYRIHKLKLAEDARANLVKRVISRDEEEDLSWEVDDDDEVEEKEENKEEESKEEESKEEESKEEEEVMEKEIIRTSESLEEKKPVEDPQVKNLEVAEATSDENVPTIAGKADNAESSGDDLISKSDDKVLPEGKVELAESCKDSDVSVVSSQPSMQEEDDLGWDEIEDLGEHDEKKVSSSDGSPNKLDLRKRLSTAEEDEDLTWDIEDDDEPARP